MKITQAKENEIDLLSRIVSESNKDVAKMFNLTIDNAPKHPSFCKPDWVHSEIRRGQKYFICTEDDIAKGCVAFEQPNQTTTYLNRLSVLPEYRRKGIGSELVNYIIEYSKEKKANEISIGLIAEHAELINWYGKLGFQTGTTQKFEHLPFNVLYMRYYIK